MTKKIYKIESNGKNKLVERKYYKKGNEFLIIEKTLSEFIVIVGERPKDAQEKSLSYINLSEFMNLKYADFKNKLYFSSGISSEDKKIIKDSLNYWNFSDLFKKGWKLFDVSNNIFGESEIIETTHNHLILNANMCEITFTSITMEECKEYLDNGITDMDSMLERLNENREFGFLEPYCQISIGENSEEDSFESDLIELSKTKVKKENTFYQIPPLSIVCIEENKGGEYNLDIYGEFDSKNLRAIPKKFVWGKGSQSQIKMFTPYYNDENFECWDAGRNIGECWYLIDAKGKVHGL